MGLVKGGFRVMLCPQELVTVNVPVVGGAVTVIVPETEYVLLAGLQALAVAVMAVMLQSTAQLVVPVLVGSEENVMFPACCE